MNIMSQFSERLKELMVENDLTVERLSEIINISDSTIYNWLTGKALSMPAVLNIIDLADIFNCSIDFLIGKEEFNSLSNPKKAPSFSKIFRRKVTEKGFSLYKLGNLTQMGTAQYYEWINGKSLPSLYSLIKISNVLDCSIDYLVGRE